MSEVTTTTTTEYRVGEYGPRLEHNTTAIKPFYLYAGFTSHDELRELRDAIDAALSNHPEPEPTQ